MAPNFAYGLCVEKIRDDELDGGGRVYLGILLSTSIALLLLAVAWTWQAAGTLDFRSGGILAGKLDERWLPILLALYASVVKAGVFTVMKVVVYIFGLDLLGTDDRGQHVWLRGWPALTILLASLIALTSKDNLKARLAYSTVSQLSYIVLGAALANRLGRDGRRHAHRDARLRQDHAVLLRRRDLRRRAQDRDQRHARHRPAMPVTTFAFLIGALSVIGLPPMGGSWSKWYLALGAVDAGTSSARGRADGQLAAEHRLPDADPDPRLLLRAAPEGAPTGIHEAPLFCVVPLCFTAVWAASCCSSSRTRSTGC